LGRIRRLPLGGTWPEARELIEAYFEPMSEQLERLKALVSDPDAPDIDPERLVEYGEAMSSAWATFTGSRA
jgi:hypothetical protein